MKKKIVWTWKKMAIVAVGGAVVTVAADFAATAVVGEDDWLLVFLFRSLVSVLGFLVLMRWADRTS
jgi:hypothetical protein